MAKNDRYQELADHILELMGGRDNINFFIHCITRLRFNLNNKELVKVDEIQKLGGVMNCQWQGDQFQIIIGQAVKDAYDLVCEVNGLNTDKKNSGEQVEASKKKFGVNTIFDAISGCIAPIIPALIGAGMLKVICLIISMTGIISTDSSTYMILDFAGDAGFYFLPIFVGASSARKFGANMCLGMLLGAIFIHPNFIAAVAGGTSLTIFGIPVYATTYTSSIFPVMLSVWVMAHVEKFIAKKSPDVLRTLLEPLLTIVIMLPLALCVFGPIGSFVGTYVSQAIIWLYNATGFIGVAVFTAIFPLLVITGMHTALTPYLLNSLLTVGYEPIILVGMCISNFNVGVAAFAVALKSKDVTTKSTAASCGITAVAAGVTEPVIFGVNVRYKTPLYASIIGNLVGGIIAGIGKVASYEITGAAGVFAFPAYLSGGLSNLLWLLVAVVAGVIVTFVLTLIMYKEPTATMAAEDTTTEQKELLETVKEEIIYAPTTGKVVPLSEIKDETFANEVLGQGIAIDTEDGNVYAPFSGEISTVFPTKHALGMTSATGCELLIHIGIDTVSLNGKHFESFVSDHAQVKKGDLLLKFDKEGIIADGYDPTVIIVVTNSDDYQKIDKTENTEVATGTTLMKVEV
jgi:beta-glucoside PTS system EIICBA component